jgi:hypothetical protein
MQLAFRDQHYRSYVFAVSNFIDGILMGSHPVRQPEERFTRYCPEGLALAQGEKRRNDCERG